MEPDPTLPIFDRRAFLLSCRRCSYGRIRHAGTCRPAHDARPPQLLQIRGRGRRCSRCSRTAAPAQAYPTRPVRVIVTTGPGGQGDTTARLVAAKLTESLGQSFYIENMPGGGGNIAMAATARAAPDGYTILAATSNIVTNISLYPKISYDPYKDFEPISLMCSSPHVLVVHPSIPAKSVNELVALAKASPGKYSYASAGRGTPAHLAGELFKLAFGVDITHVPFNGGGPATAVHARRPCADRGVGPADGGDLYPWRPICARLACSAANARRRCRTCRP